MIKVLSKYDIDKLKAYVDKETILQWEGMLNRQNAEDKIIIANTGLFSSGKSSLFNALLDQTDVERFPVGAIPTTKKGDRERLNEHVEIVDTPGIDASAEDDEAALNMLIQADLIIMTHNVKMGMLNKSEFEWLRGIAERIPGDELKRRLMFVCTWMDALPVLEDLEKVKEEIRRQIEMAVGQEIAFLQVSAKRYCLAKKKNNPQLQTASNIPLLKEYLKNWIEQYEKIMKQERKKELHILCQFSERQLQVRQKKLEQEYENRKSQIDKKYLPVIRIWKSKWENFMERRRDINDMLEKLRQEDLTDDYDIFKRKIKGI